MELGRTKKIRFKQEKFKLEFGPALTESGFFVSLIDCTSRATSNTTVVLHVLSISFSEDI